MLTVRDCLSYVGCNRYQQSKEQSEPPASQVDEKDGTEVRVEPEEMVGSCWLETQVFNSLGIHLKFGLYCNQRCQFQLVFALFLVNALAFGVFLELLILSVGVTTTSFETVVGVLPKVDLGAVVDLEGMPDLRFL